jgi:dTMP kinase
MAARGKLIAIEGIDGAGKRTQCELLGGALHSRGAAVVPISFPRYQSTFGRLIGQFLNGELGNPQTIDARFSALLYAGDRLEAKVELVAALAAGKMILADRYVASNLAHQAARVDAAKRDEFIAWVRHIEYDIYGLPEEDLTIYLRLTPSEAQRLIAKKPAREYTTRERDVMEADLTHLERAAAVYDLLAKQQGWVTVECFDPAKDTLRTPAEIHGELLAAVTSRVLSSVTVD